MGKWLILSHIGAQMWATNAYGTFWKICAFAPFHGRFFCIFDRFIPKNRQLRAPTHSLRSIQLGIERDISSTGFRHPNENWGHYPPVPRSKMARAKIESPQSDTRSQTLEMSTQRDEFVRETSVLRSRCDIAVHSDEARAMTGCDEAESGPAPSQRI